MTELDQIEDDEEYDPAFEALRFSLELLYKGRQRIEREGASLNGSLLYLWSVLSFARTLIGETTYNLAMRTPQSGPDVLLLAHRLQAVTPFMAGAWPETLNYETFVEEVYAIAGGDSPRILAQTKKRKGKAGNAFRVATHKAQALIWQRVLRRRKYSAAESDTIVSIAFKTNAETLAKWEKECRAKLGDQEVNKHLMWSETVDQRPWGEFFTDAEVRDAITVAGAKYWAERNRQSD